MSFVVCFTTCGFAEDGSTSVEEGIALLKGDRVPRDWTRARKLLEAGALEGDRRAQYHLAEMYYLGQGGRLRHSVAIEWYARAAEQGHAKAQLRLGYFSTVGHSVPRDLETAVHWFRRAAQNGEAAAQAWLGAMYVHGRGVEKDVEEAVQWFRRAADQGSAEAQCALGILCFTGIGVEQDYEEAYIWLSLAAEQHVVPAGFASAATAAKHLSKERLGDAQTRIDAVRSANRNHH